MLQIEIVTEDNDLASICKLYWEVDANLDFVHNVGELAELAKINKVKLASVVREACRATISDWKCSNCEKPIVFSGRTEFNKKRSLLINSEYHQHSFICADCEKKKREKEAEEKIKQDEDEKQALELDNIELRKKIREIYDLAMRPLINVQELSLTDAVYLISILRGGAYENLTKIIPVSLFEHSLSSDDEFSTEIINHLYANGLLYVHPDSEPKAFKKDNISTFYIYHVYYAPPLCQTAPDDPKILISELLNRINAEWSEEWCQEALKIWKKVALSECKQYLLFVLQEHHFGFTPGEKTTQYLEYALEHYSTAQVYNTIWRAVKDAAAYFQREDVSKRQAATMAIASIQRITDRAIAENWEIKPFGRNFKCPQSLISEVLYNSALKFGDEGFQLIPNIDTVRTKKLAV